MIICATGREKDQTALQNKRLQWSLRGCIVSYWVLILSGGQTDPMTTWARTDEWPRGDWGRRQRAGRAKRAKAPGPAFALGSKEGKRLDTEYRASTVLSVLFLHIVAVIQTQAALDAAVFCSHNMKVALPQGRESFTRSLTIVLKFPDKAATLSPDARRLLVFTISPSTG